MVIVEGSELVIIAKWEKERWANLHIEITLDEGVSLWKYKILLKTTSLEYTNRKFSQCFGNVRLESERKWLYKGVNLLRLYLMSEWLCPKNINLQ